MSQKSLRITYYVSTILLSLVMAFSTFMYLFRTPMVRTMFADYGFPEWLVIPLAFAKILGVLAIWTRISRWAKEWAYAGFFFDFVLATATHLIQQDGAEVLPILSLLFLLASYYADGQLFGNAASNVRRELK